MDWQRCQTRKTLISAGALLNSGPIHVTNLYFCFRGSVTFTKYSIEETNINLIYSTSVGFWQQYPFIYLFDLLEKYFAFPTCGEQVFVTLPIHIWFPDEWVGWLSGWGLFGGFHSVVKPQWKSEEQAGEGVRFVLCCSSSDWTLYSGYLFFSEHRIVHCKGTSACKIATALKICCDYVVV